MPTFHSATVTEILAEREGLQRLAVRMQDGSDARAYCLTELTGDAAPGDRVVCNTTAVELGLGTGGWHVVHWNLERSDLVAPGPDHVMKLRYTSLQADVGTSELAHPEQADRRLGGTPVVVCTLHSQMAVVAAAFSDASRGRRLAYVMTDGAALPIAMSDLVAALRDRDLLVGTVTAGHAFGGDLEAVSPASALTLATHVLEADAVVVAMGPGVVGTSSALGTTSVEAAGLLDTVQRLGGRPVLCVRCSEADERERHRGVSHHVHTALSLTHCRPVVADVAGTLDAGVRAACEPLVPATTPAAAEILGRHSLAVTTMGRGPAEDPPFFDAAVGAGVLAAQLTD
ncbi:MAG: DUF3866 family protein [Actinomycetia bacterium]|nr:DUF3866 family protein [Actinomycetes bacterium]